MTTKEQIKFPIEPHKLGEIAEQNALEVGEPFPRQPDRAKGDGDTTCLWHRCHEWTMKHYVPLLPSCTICGGLCDPRLEAHELCKALAKRNMPVKQLSVVHPCNCAKCAAKRN